jgi:hypothetical protein
MWTPNLRATEGGQIGGQRLINPQKGMYMAEDGLPRIPADAEVRDRFQGCLLGGAIGDALGAVVNSMSRTEIVARFGSAGIRDYAPAFGRLGAITSHTQMSLFTY